MNSKKVRSALKIGMIIIGVIVIPMLYSYFYLDAFWDPYNRLNTLPVAIVNEDKGAEINSENRNLGSEMVKELKDDGTLKWVETNVKDADSGVESGKYYARIIIPEGFSQSVSSAQTTDKQIAQLDYRVNQKKNYIAAQLLGKAVQTIEMKTDSKINESITQSLTAKLNEVPGKLGELNDGLGQIYDGTTSLKDGATQVSNGTGALKKGASALYSGSQKLSGGITSLDSGLTTLKNGAQTLALNLAALDSGIGDALTGAKKLQAGAAAVPTLNAGITQLNTAASGLNAQMVTSTNGTPTLYDNVNLLNSGANTYVTNVNETISGMQADLALFNTVNQQINDSLPVTPQSISQVASLYKMRALLADLNNSNEVADLNSKDTDPSIMAVKQAIMSAITGSAYTGPLPSSAALAQTIQQQFATGGSQLTGGTALLLAQFGTGTATAPTLKDAVSGIAGGTATLSANEPNLSAMQKGINDLAAGLDSAKSGSSQLAAGAKDLQSGAASAKDGSSALAAGASGVSSGASQLNNGILQLDSGAKALTGGIDSLSSGVATAKDKVGSSISDTNSQLAATKGLDTFANKPINVTETDDYPVPNYGTSFAPYFLSLSLYVGALVMFVGIFLDPKKRMRALCADSTHRMLRVGAFALIGVGQALLLCIILIYALHLKTYNTVGFYLSAILVSIVFISIVEFLMVYLADIGKFLAIAFLVLQLTSCAGAFPMETVPSFFNNLYPYMPMTYSVRLFKDVISGYSNTDLTHNVYVLLGIFAIFTALTMLLSITRRAKVRIKAKLEAEQANV